jgi:tetratricopeptide (TPR) repeat protein
MNVLRKYAHELRRPRTVLAALLLLAVIGVAGYFAWLGLWAGSHFRAAEKALESNDFSKARAHLLLCLEAWPRTPEVHFLLARTARRAGDFEEAKRRLALCEEYGGIPENIELERLLQRAQRGEFAGIESVLGTYVRAGHPEKAVILEAMASGYMQTFRLPQALEALDLWLEQEPNNPQAHVWRGQALEHLRRYTESRESFRRAVELDPKLDDARLALAESLLQGSSPQEALPHFSQLHERRPGSLEVALGLADCQATLGQRDEARRLLEKCVLDFPASADAWVQLGKLELDAENPAKAEPMLRAGHNRDPYHREGTYQLIQCLRQLKKNDEIPPLKARLDEIEQMRKQLTELTKSMLKTPRNASLRCAAGEIFLKAGNEKEALRWMQSALQEDPTHPQTHAALAKYFRDRGNERLAAYHEKAAGK